MSARGRGGRYLETAHINHGKPKANIGSKFPELGAVHPERDDCAPPLLVCGRCPVCHKAAARGLAGLALRSGAFAQEGGPDAEHVDRAAGLRTSLLALGILGGDDDTEGTKANEPSTEEPAA